MRTASPILACSLAIFFCLGASRHGVAAEPEMVFPSQVPHYAQPTPLREDATLRSVAFNSEGMGIACGDRGTILRTSDHGATWQASESGLDCTLSSVQWVASNRALIVGGALDRITGISRGIVLTSDDGGVTWKRSGDQELPRLRTLAWEEGTIFASGDWSSSLLTNRFESRDRGRTWNAGLADIGEAAGLPSASEWMRWVEATQIPMVVRHACRVSLDAICAVGDHGAILISRDRGKTWIAVRGEGRQTAILIVARDAQSLPWALLGNETLESRNRVAVLLQDVTDRDEPGNLNIFAAANQAVIALGGTGVDALHVGELDVEGGDPLLAATQWIGIHRPAVVVIDAKLDDAISHALLDAATAGGAQRVIRYAFATPGATSAAGDTTLHHESLLTKSGVLASDLHADAMHWVDPFHVESKSIHLNWLYNASAGDRRGDSIVAGLSLSVGRQLAAPGPVLSRRKLQIAQARMNQSSRTADLVERSQTVDQFSQSIAQALDLTSKEDQLRLGWSLVVATARHNTSLRDVRIHEAALDEFASRFAATTAGRWAALRREVIHHSVEWKRLRSLLSETVTAIQPIPTAESIAVSPFQISGGDVRQTSGVSPLVVPKPEMIDLNHQGKSEEVAVDLNWEFHPAVLFAREAARLRSDEGQLQATSEQSANLNRLAESNLPWSELLNRNGSHVIVANRAASPPRLDGDLMDDCWRDGIVAEGSPTPIRVSYDDDYVYVAVTCPADRLRSDTQASPGSASVRDQELSQVDHMAIWIDVDRDLMSSMQLQVSDGGRVHDAIDGHSAWQPTWYPAIRRQTEELTFEIAILRRDIVELPIVAGESWLILAQPMRVDQAPPSTISPNPKDWYRIAFEP